MALQLEEAGGDAEATAGTLRCVPCARTFPIVDGIPALVEPASLAADLAALGPVDEPYARTYDRANKVWLLKRGLVAILWETRVRAALLAQLQLRPGARLLETAVGTASNLSVAATIAGPSVELHGTDLSSGMLRVARRKMTAAALTQANAEHLPYQDEMFDAVLHVGAINQLGDKSRAIAEMYRVAKPGARLLISDEGVHPDKARTWHGRWILRHDAFRAAPPLDLLPERITDLRVSWVLHRSFWALAFAKAG
jgi:ubiquinone/menaquinone biosynthesis C-methylase UbiE